MIKGKGLTASNLRNLLEASYSGAEFPAENWAMDKELSGETARVFKHPSGQVVVAHRGTEASATDWGNNAWYASTGEVGYKQTDRFKKSKAVQKNAEAKYGAQFVTTIGHSQGGLLAEYLGKNSREIITLNKATSPWSDNTAGKNQYDIRSDCDKVSMFRNPLKKPGRNDTVIKGKRNILGCKDSVAEHSYDILNRRDANEVFGDRAFYDQVNAAYKQQLNVDRVKTAPSPPPPPAPKPEPTPAPVPEAPVEEKEEPIEGGRSRAKCISDFSTKYVSKDGLKESYDRGIGAHKTNPSSVRNLQGKKGVGGKKLPKEQWACARAKKLSEKGPKAGYDKDLLKGKGFSTAGDSPDPAGLEGKGIAKYSKDKAKSLGVDIKPSTKKGKKIDVFKEGKLVASIGAKGYKDYPIYLAENGKEEADKRRKLYKKRHEKDRHTPGTPSFYADNILW